MDIPKTSRAAVVDAYTVPIEIREVPIPDDLEPGAILVRTAVATMCGSDVHLYTDGRIGSFVVEQPLTLGHEIAGEMLQCSPTSLALTRRALYAGMEGTIENAMQFESLAIERCYQSAEHKEYVSAFMEKRKPDFRRVKK